MSYKYTTIASEEDAIPSQSSEEEQQTSYPSSYTFDIKNRKHLSVVIIAVVCFSAFIGVAVRLSRTPASSVAASAVEAQVASSVDPTSVPAAEENDVRPIFRDQKKTCKDPLYSHKTLKLAHEMPMVALIGNPNGPAFEASCIKKVGDFFYVVSDDSPDIAKVGTDLQYGDPDNGLIIRQASTGGDEISTTEGGYEAFFYDSDDDTYHGIIEAVSLGEPDKFHSIVDNLKIDAKANTYVRTGSCPSDYEFVSSNKGFEGAILIKHEDGNKYLVGLCEGNFCVGGVKGRTPGNGRLVVLKQEANVDLHGKKYKCAWKTVKEVALPGSVNFVDYSAIALRGNRVAISSQENAQVFIGTMDLKTFEVAEEGEVYNFPRDDDCDIVYCNVEGLEWLNDHMLAAASDQMKDMNRQPYRCLAKDQSAHVFVIPPKYVPEEGDD